MTVREIPIQAVPSQTVAAVLSAQNCQIAINAKSQGVFVTVSVDGVAVVSSVIARDGEPIICREYSGFVGNLAFVDTRGNSDPEFSGFGTRFVLIYTS